MQKFNETGGLRKIAEARHAEPMNTWPVHNDWHRRNSHPFAGSKSGELYWDEECLRCQLEKVAAEQITPHLFGQKERWSKDQSDWWNRLHEIWTWAVGKPGYNKTAWEALQKEIQNWRTRPTGKTSRKK